MAECADGAVDGKGRSSRGKDGNSRLLYRQRGTIGVDKREGPVCGGWVMVGVKGRLLGVVLISLLH